MKVEILLVTYRKDLEFTSYALQSIAKFGSGFSGITLVVPHQDKEAFKPLADRYGCSLRNCIEVPNKGFLGHMASKCQGDIWCPKGTDIVCHIDSDCIFGEPFTPATFMDGEKPLLVREHYDDFIQYQSRYGWKKNSLHALGFDCEWETMVRHPSLYHVDMYRRLRNHIEDLHGYPFDQYVLLQRNEFPQTFSEFPTMGAFLLQHDSSKYRIVTCVHTPGKYWADEKWLKLGIEPVARDPSTGIPTTKDHPMRFLWHLDDGSVEQRPLINPVRYFWSKKGVTPEYRKQIEAILT